VPFDDEYGKEREGYQIPDVVRLLYEASEAFRQGTGELCDRLRDMVARLAMAGLYVLIQQETGARVSMSTL
jgi:hypothetical protein